MARNTALELIGGIPFGLASFVRGRRIFHPRGVAFRGQLEPDEDGRDVADLLASRRHDLVTVRISNGAGLPAPLPDVRGFAIRIHDAHGRGRHQDLVLATGAAPVALRNLLLPARLTSSFFSSILPYRVGGRIVLFGATARTPLDAPSLEELSERVSRSPVTFDLLVAEPLGSWERVGAVRLRETLSARQSTDLRFNPTNTGPGVRPLGLLNSLRDPAYRWSQIARRVRGEGPDAAPEAGPGRTVEHIRLSR